MLSLGTYRGELYDIGYDRPETHAVQKGEVMYYAFYAPSYTGKVELRGLDKKSYSVMDYVNNKSLGNLKGPNAELEVSFVKHLLIEAKPN
jgi:alpha-galactosidase